MFGDGWFLGAMDSYLRLKRADTKSTYVYLLSSKISISFTSQTGADPDRYYGWSFSIIPWIRLNFF